MRAMIKKVFNVWLGLLLPFLWAGLVFPVSPVCASSQSDLPPAHRIGINLSSTNYYSSEFVFTDIFKQSQPWQENWESPEAEKQGLILDEKGWVQALASDQIAQTLLYRVQGHYPSGEYVCVYSGQGEIELDFDAQVVHSEPGRIVFQVTHPSPDGIALRLKETDIIDPLQDIAIYPPGFVPNTAGTFHPRFVQHWQDFQILRFMDWMQTNNSGSVDWEDRPLPEAQTQGGPQGVALEYMIELANTLHADPWFCMPHKASEDYIRRFASMVRDRLDPELQVYVEYSNEVWNSRFEQAEYCRNLGSGLGLSEDPFQAQLMYYAQRAVEVFQVWEEVFGGTERLVRVLSSQFANPWVSRQVLSSEQAYAHADALAVAPYFGQSLGSPERAETTALTPVDAILEACEQEIVESGEIIAEHSAIAKKYGLRLVAYEGGQHLVGYLGAENNEQLTELFIAANRDERMQDLYDLHLGTWYEHGGQEYCAFASMGLYNKWGSWGLLEHGDQDVKEAPKYQGCKDYIQLNIEY